MTITTLCYIEKNGCYLMLNRNKKKDDANSGKWLGVGGHLEKNETPNECILREVREETGIELNNVDFRGNVFFFSDFWEDECIFVYTAKTECEPSNDCNEGTLAWIEKEKLLSLPMWEGDKHFLKIILGGKGRFCMRLGYNKEKLTQTRIFEI